MKTEKITEEQKIHKEWYVQAKEQSLNSLPAFLNHIMNDYEHDYGTICHALAAGSIATAWAMNRHKNGGITGFQSGAVMWEFIRNWNFSNNKCGLKLIDNDNFLYPQYSDNFQKVMSEDTFESIRKQASVNIKEADDNMLDYQLKQQKYEADLKEFVKKYPDYLDNKGHYEHLGMGTGDEWEAEREKENSGFEFAPMKPYCSVFKDSPVYKHWQSIANGTPPFGYSINN